MCLNQARYGIAWGALGAAMDCYDGALEYAKERIQFGGQPIAGHQLVQEKLVWMVSEITKGQLLVLQLGRLKDAGKVAPADLPRQAQQRLGGARVRRLAREILGANGIVDDYPMMRHMLNIESVYTYEGTHDIHGLIIGEAHHRHPRLQPPPERVNGAAAAAAGGRREGG